VCPPARKSLVKGERFIRPEGRPELTALHRAGCLYCLTTRNTCGFCVISTIVFIPHSLHHEYRTMAELLLGITVTVHISSHSFSPPPIPSLTSPSSSSLSPSLLPLSPSLLPLSPSPPSSPSVSPLPCFFLSLLQMLVAQSAANLEDVRFEAASVAARILLEQVCLFW